MLGIIGGTSFVKSDVLTSCEKEQIVTPYGSCTVYGSGDALFIARQGKKGELPPHRINHQKHLSALKRSGVQRIISFGSVGSLSADLHPGTLVMVDDYFAPFKPATFNNDKLHFTVPEISASWRKNIFEALKNADLKPLDHGIYAETLGPRFETKAEIKWLSSAADVVGMTCASEATLANELNIPHCIIAMVDNYCNGITSEPLSGDLFREQASKNTTIINKAFQAVIQL